MEEQARCPWQNSILRTLRGTTQSWVLDFWSPFKAITDKYIRKTNQVCWTRDTGILINEMFQRRQRNLKLSNQNYFKRFWKWTFFKINSFVGLEKTITYYFIERRRVRVNAVQLTRQRPRQLSRLHSIIFRILLNFILQFYI